MAVPRQLLRRSLLSIGAVVLLVVVAPLLAVAIGITVDAGPWRAQAAEAMASALHRKVSFDGPAEIHLSLQPSLHVGGIRIGNPPGFGATEFASLGDARFALDLMPLLRYQVSVHEVSARDVKVRLEATADGKFNWQFGTDAAMAAPKSAADAASPNALTRDDIKGVGIDRFSLERVAVEFVGANGKSHYFTLDALDGTAGVGKPLAVKMRGNVEQKFPYSVDIGGGPLSQLVAATGKWPLHFALAFAGTTLDLDGTLDHALDNGGGDIDFDLRTDDLSQIEKLLQIELPPVGATALAASVHWQPQQVRVSKLHGTMGKTSLDGHLEYSGAGPRPRLAGELDLPTLDLRPFLGQPVTDDEPPRSLLDTYRALEKQTFDLRRLALMDADVTLKVGRWLSIPGDVHDASLVVKLEDGVLHMPLAATVAQVPLAGEVVIDGKAAVPGFRLELKAADTRLGGLAALLAYIDGMDGDLDRFDFRILAKGENVGALTRSLDIRLGIDGGRLSYGNVEGGKPVEFRLDHFEVLLPPGAALTGRMQGSLLGEAFAAKFRTGDLPALARDLRWPLTFEAQASGARLDVAGVLAAPEVNDGIDMKFRLAAPRAGSVARWLGLSPDAEAKLLLSGHLRGESDEVWLRDFVFELGRTAMTGTFARTGADGPKPLIMAKLDIARVDAPELEKLLPPPKPAAPKPAATRTTLDIPILPKGIDLSDADIDIKLQRAVLEQVEITAVTFTGRVRDGRMEPSPFGATVAGTSFYGSAAVDLRSDVPEVALQLGASKVDIGELLRRLKVADGIEAGVEGMLVSLTGRGSRLAEILERSDFRAELIGGQMVLRDPAGKPLVTVDLTRSVAAAPPGKPVTLDIDGTIDQMPVTIRLATARLSDLARTGEQVPLHLSAEAAATRLELDGRVTLPVREQKGDLELTVSGANLNDLDKLAHVDLPPWGPWSFGGKFKASARGYEVPDLQVRVGSSTLGGRGTMTFSGVRPRIDVSLTAPNIQLDDFKLGDWSAAAKKPATTDRKLTPDEMRKQAREAAQSGQRLLSRATLLKQDAFLDVEVAQVLSGKDRLGSGRLHAQLQDARLELSPVEVNVPGGSARIELGYEPLPDNVNVKVRAQVRVDRFDYGVLARRIKPDTDLQGRFSFNLDLDSTAPLDGVMQKGNGKLDVAVWPINLKSGIFDMWAVNLFVALIPAVDDASASKVNCAIARFDLVDGKLRQDMVLIDTTRMRVGGTARVDFADETIAVHLQPQAKQPQFFSLATPIDVSGHVTAPKIALGGAIMSTIGNFFGSIVTTPFAMLTAKTIPRDGADVCEQGLRGGG